MDEELRAVPRLVIAPLSAAIGQMVAVPDLAFAETMRVRKSSRRRRHAVALGVVTLVVVIPVVVILGERRAGGREESRGGRGDNRTFHATSLPVSHAS